jgi:hypothetical protein
VAARVVGSYGQRQKVVAITISRAYVSVRTAVSEIVDKNLFLACSSKYYIKMLARIFQGHGVHIKIVAL